MRASLKVIGFGCLMLLLAACGGSTGGGDPGAAPAASRDEQAPAALVCGGLDGKACAQGYHCVDDPADTCDPASGGADCGGICVLGDALPSCAADTKCPAGYVCTTDPAAACNGSVAADCPGVCRPEAQSECSSDADCPQLKVMCSVCADGTVSCPESHCDNGQCNISFTACPLPPLGCGVAGGVACEAGFHCLVDPTCAADMSVTDCKSACVPDENPIQCGGFAGLTCPPGFVCIDDAGDTCDPQTGGADCGGICQPANDAECQTDADCPQLRAACSVCADGTTACPKSYCGDGKCIVDFPTCAMPTPCGIDGCKPGDVCVDDPNDRCDPATGADCSGICVPDSKPRPCGGDVGDVCPPGYACASDPASRCSPDSAGTSISCLGVCVPVSEPQCNADQDCVQILGGCLPCVDGTYACPHSRCRDGMCAVLIDACAGPGFCGGIAGFPCPPGSTCIDNPRDNCDPNQGGADCGGICVREETPLSCGGFTGAPCPDGYECADDASDQCDPANGGADCPGICRPAASPKCTDDAECPQIAAPCRLCEDGMAACPRSFCDNGKCNLDFPTCATPVPCDGGCSPGQVCVVAPNDGCDPATGVDCRGIGMCVPDNKPRPCGGDLGDTCPPGYTCAPDPLSRCNPDSAGTGCRGVCAPESPPNCSTDQDCVQAPGPCTPCADGTLACSRSECRDGSCIGVADACAAPGFCGGIAGFPCPPGLTCVDNPRDGCDPNQGGADCGGICVRQEPPPPSCGGFTGAPCPAGYECVDQPDDQCDPASGGADCPGICQPPAVPKCTSDAECPQIGAPCRVCDDGTAACPRSYCENGLCKAEFKTCGDT